MIIQKPRFYNAYFCALAWNDPACLHRLPQVTPLQSVSRVAHKQARTHMNETALNGCSEPETEIFTARDTLWLLAFHDTHRVSCFKILASHQLHLTDAVLIAVTTSFEIFAVPLSTE